MADETGVARQRACCRRFAIDRSRSLQRGQRYSRPCRGRPSADHDRRAHEGGDDAGRIRRTPWRRRIRGGPAGQRSAPMRWALPNGCAPRSWNRSRWITARRVAAPASASRYGRKTPTMSRRSSTMPILRCTGPRVDRVARLLLRRGDGSRRPRSSADGAGTAPRARPRRTRSPLAGTGRRSHRQNHGYEALLRWTKADGTPCRRRTSSRLPNNRG